MSKKKSKKIKLSCKAGQSHPRLMEALSMVGNNKTASHLPKAFQLVVWELMRTQTDVQNLREAFVAQNAACEFMFGDIKKLKGKR